MGKMTTHHALLPNPEITTHKNIVVTNYYTCEDRCGWMLTHAALVYAGILGTKVQKNEGRC